jgi:hypothetical protein
MSEWPLCPECPRCGRLAEWIGESISCQSCDERFDNWLYGLIDPEAFAALVAQMEQDNRLGIDLDRRPEEA